MIHGVVIGTATATTPAKQGATVPRLWCKGRRFRLTKTADFWGEAENGSGPCDRFSARTRVLALIT